MRNRQHNYKKDWGGFWESVFILLEVIDVTRAITLLYSIYITQYAIYSTAYYL